MKGIEKIISIPDILRGKAKLLFPCFYLQTHLRMVFHRIQALMIIDKQIASAVLFTDAGPERLQIFRIIHQRFGKPRLHGAQLFPKILKEKGEQLYFPEAFPYLSVFSHRRVEIVIIFRQIIPGTCSLRFLQRTVFPLRIRSAVIHIISQQVGSAAELHQRHGTRITRGGHRPSVSGGLQSSSQLRCQVRIVSIRCPCGLLFPKIASDIRIIPFRREYVIPIGGKLFQAPVPGGVAVSSHDREQPRGMGASPAGSCHIRRLKPRVQGQFCQNTHMRFPFFPIQPAAAAIFIFNLYADNRASVFPQQPPDLFRQYGKIGLYLLQISLIIRPWFIVLFHDPVRQPAVPHFAMAPWADPQEHRKARILHRMKEASQIPVPGEVIFPFLLLMVDPENIGRDNRHSARFHFSQGFRPELLRITGIMEFPHNRKPGLPVFQKEVTVIRIAAFFFIHPFSPAPLSV